MMLVCARARDRQDTQPPPPRAAHTYALVGVKIGHQQGSLARTRTRFECTRLDNLVRHEGGDIGRFAEELMSPRGVSLPHQLHAALQVGLPLGPALLLLPSLGRKVAAVEDQVRLNPVTQE